MRDRSINTANQPEASSEALNLVPQTVAVPRWVIYFQAALLGLVATTFFIFGLMVGTLSSGSPADETAVFDCEVSGTVHFSAGDQTQPDAGSVIFILPADRRPEERAAGNLVSPDGFEPLNNPGIEIVNRLGGAVVRTDVNGAFNVKIDASEAGLEYYLLVVSKNVAETEPNPLSKLQVAAIGTFYLPVERVMNDRAIYWSAITAKSRKIELPAIEF